MTDAEKKQACDNDWNDKELLYGKFPDVDAGQQKKFSGNINRIEVFMSTFKFDV